MVESTELVESDWVVSGLALADQTDSIYVMVVRRNGNDIKLCTNIAPAENSWPGRADLATGGRRGRERQQPFGCHPLEVRPVDPSSEPRLRVIPNRRRPPALDASPLWSDKDSFRSEHRLGGHEVGCPPVERVRSFLDECGGDERLDDHM